MNNNILLTTAARVLPILALVFVSALFVYKMYIKIRSKYNVSVNCWFCNGDTRVLYIMRNSWNCPHCDQYNGFNKDGDYNRDLIEQRDCSVNNSAGSRGLFRATPPLTNGFCDTCNEAQRIKIEKLAQFEPKNESRFDQELKVYKEELEKVHRLCRSCEIHLKHVLREKKKMVLGTKFLDFIIKGAELIKQPHFNQLQKTQQLKRQRILIRVIRFLTFLNVWCLCVKLPHLTSQQFHGTLGYMVGQPLFIAYSHSLALLRVLASLCAGISQFELLVKVQLFVRIIAAMLMYSMGLTLPQVTSWSWHALFSGGYPYIMLCLCFMYNVVDGFKFSRLMTLLLYWSTHAAVLSGGLDNSGVLLIASFVSLLITISVRIESSSVIEQDEDKTANSFHKLCADDYLSDETISMLSQQLNCSNNSSTSCYNAEDNSRLRHRRYNGNFSPLSRSMYKSISPNNRFQTTGTNFDYTANRRTMLSPGPSACASNLELYSSSGGVGAQQPTILPIHCQLNNSFSHPSTMIGNQTAHLATPAYNPATLCNFPSQQRLTGIATPLHSPFSVSSNAAYQQQTEQQQQAQRLLHPIGAGSIRSSSNLLMPSRFSTNNLNFSHNKGDETSAWVAANSIGFTGHINTQNLSRTSSQSSGFESQHGHVVPQQSFGFEAIGTHAPAAAPAPAAPMSSSAFMSPCTDMMMNINPTATFDTFSRVATPLPSHNGTMFRKQMTANHHHNNSNYRQQDTFNLRKINDDLPTIRRGDLLRKWNENRMTAQKAHIG